MPYLIQLKQSGISPKSRRGLTLTLAQNSLISWRPETWYLQQVLTSSKRPVLPSWLRSSTGSDTSATSGVYIVVHFSPSLKRLLFVNCSQRHGVSISLTVYIPLINIIRFLVPRTHTRRFALRSSESPVSNLQNSHCSTCCRSRTRPPRCLWNDPGLYPFN